MNLQEAFSYISNESTRVSKPGLERIHRCMELLGHPECKLPLVHVVGTNGKGSVSTMLTAVLTAAGYRIGTMISPYMDTLLDLYRIQGTPPEEQQYIHAVERVRTALQGSDCAPTEFELSVAVGICMFEAAECNLIILEAGMGGGADATNLCTSALLTIVTCIGFDHTAFLGEDILSIAKEKLSIAKPGESIVLGVNSDVVTAYAEQYCLEHTLTLHYAQPYYDDLLGARTTISVQSVPDTMRLNSTYQQENVAAVLAALHMLYDHFPVPPYAITEGLQNAYIPYRFDVRHENPSFILDGGHNPDGIRALITSLRAHSGTARYHIVTGVMKDKNYDEMYKMLAPYAYDFLTITPENARAFPADELAKYLRELGYLAEAESNRKTTVLRIRDWLEAGENVLITGSLYMMSALDKALSMLIQA